MSSNSQNISRKQFIKIGASLAAVTAVAPGCILTGDRNAHILGGMVESGSGIGHLLRSPDTIPAVDDSIEAEEWDVVIVGGGISGLSALRWLRKYSNLRVLLIELNSKAGGNADWSCNSTSAYPWGAHYLPIPDIRNTELLQFLEDIGTITGYQDKLPVYNEYHLCAAPEERLFYKGYWQEGLIPTTDVTDDDRKQIKRFLDKVNELRNITGKDGKDAFRIPLALSSRDDVLTRLDKISFAEYLDKEGYSSKPLRWYLEYCCKDDYGLLLDQTSAWAGLHYFSSRKGKGVNAKDNDVLTWPEGNGFLMEALKKQYENNLATNQLVYRVSEGERCVRLWVYDANTRLSRQLKATDVVFAAPQHVTSHVLPKTTDWQQVLARPLIHTPWLIANLTLKQIPESSSGSGLCWDNVLYGTPSVGYVNAGQQQLTPDKGTVLTYYKPLCGGDANAMRRKAQNTSYRQWLNEIISELSTAHPDIDRNITHADIRIWGHGMAGPAPGCIFYDTPSLPSTNIHLAHTDYSGVSIFEEAFYQGINAAKSILKA